MSEKDRGKITFDGLQRFLRQIGFDQTSRINRSLAFHHRSSGTLLMLSIPEDGRSVRSADLLSIQVRLESQGLINDAALSEFKSGRLPMAS